MTRSSRRWAVAIGALAAAATPATAHADAAGPTDYRTEIVSIAPEHEVIDVAIEGGDAFMSIDVADGHRVVVLGYDDEPYLLVDESGTVFENRRSFATYYNEDRYGTDDIPAVVDHDAPPEWERIGSGGAWAWHDHRAHWMGEQPPVGLEPGDSLPTQIVPIEVDGVATEITVLTTLLPAPSRWPAAFGVVIGLAVVLAAKLAGRATVNLVLMLIATSALWVGLAQYRSLPAATGPLLTWWLMPALALACGLIVVAIYGWNRLTEHALIALGGLQLALWGFGRRSGLSSAVLPTELPFWFDRTVTALALVGGVALVAVAVLAMFPPRTES